MAQAKQKLTALSALPDAGESRGAVAVTVAWMLLTLSCLAAHGVALATWLLARMASVAGRPNHLLMVPTTLMLVALVAGILIFVFTPLTLRVRKSRPPRAITIAAIVIAIAPFVTIAVAAAIG